MPIAVKTWRDAFVWSVADDLPVAPVYELGQGRWAQCPACGCIHDCTSYQGQDYQPPCIGQHTRAFANWKRLWAERWPQAEQVGRVVLVGVEEYPR